MTVTARYGYPVSRRKNRTPTPARANQGAREDRATVVHQIKDGVPFDPEGFGGYLAPQNGSNVVVDFYKNVGLGIDGGAGIRFVRPRRLMSHELEALHIDAIGRRIAELPAYEATREGYQVRPTRPPDADLAQRIVNRLGKRADDLQLLSRLFEARWRRRTYGSCLVVVGTEDCFLRDVNGVVLDTDFSSPLEGAPEVLWLRTFDARWYRIAETYGEGHELCGQPRLYSVSGWDRPGLDADYERGSRVPATASTRLVHASRVWRDAEPEGFSIFDGLARDLARLLAGAKGAEDALTGMGIPVYKIKDLQKKLLRDEDGTRARIHAANQAKSLVKALITEMGEEEFEWQKLSLSGVSDIINSMGYVLSAATGIPMTLLFGMSPGGFSGGESEERNWHNYIRSVQRELSHGVMFVLRLLLGEAGVPAERFPFTIEWNKLVVLTDLEAVQLRDTWSQYASRSIDAGIVKPSEVRASAYGGDEFSYEITIERRQEEKAQANLGATESTAVLNLLQTYYAPGSTIPTEAARAYLAAIDPSLAAVAATLIAYRPVAPDPSLAAGAPALGAGVAQPAEDDPTAIAAVPERAPDATGNTWRTARELAAQLGTTESFVRRQALEGKVAVRVGTGRHRARQYAQEHVVEALSGVEVGRADPAASPESEDGQDERKQSGDASALD